LKNWIGLSDDRIGAIMAYREGNDKGGVTDDRRFTQYAPTYSACHKLDGSYVDYDSDCEWYGGYRVDIGDQTWGFLVGYAQNHTLHPFQEVRGYLYDANGQKISAYTGDNASVAMRFGVYAFPVNGQRWDGDTTVSDIMYFYTAHAHADASGFLFYSMLVSSNPDTYSNGVFSPGKDYWLVGFDGERTDQQSVFSVNTVLGPLQATNVGVNSWQLPTDQVVWADVRQGWVYGVPNNPRIGSDVIARSVTCDDESGSTLEGKCTQYSGNDAFWCDAGFKFTAHCRELGTGWRCLHGSGNVARCGLSN
jgi:hypothetical protein